jgi:hypothetical protein
MIKGERATFAGKWYRAENALANPRYRDHIPLMMVAVARRRRSPLRFGTSTTST